jgi:hypothetical protein
MLSGSTGNKKQIVQKTAWRRSRNHKGRGVGEAGEVARPPSRSFSDREEHRRDAY